MSRISPVVSPRPEMPEVFVLPVEKPPDGGWDEFLLNCVSEKGFLDVNEIDSWGWPVLSSTIVKGSFDATKQLLDLGASVSIPTPGGARPLHLLCGAGDWSHPLFFDILETVLANKYCHMNALDGDSATPLHCAVRRGNLQAVRRLLEHNARVNEGASTTGDTPLLRAVSADNKDMCQLLLGAGARDDFAYRKALELKGACVDLAPLMCSLSRLSDTARLSYSTGRRSLDSQVMVDTALMLPPPPDSECRIIWGVSKAPAAKIRSRTEFYRMKMYEKAHTVFGGERRDGSGEIALACVAKWPDASQCLTLCISSSFLYEMVPQSKLESHGEYVQERHKDFIWTSVPESYAVHLRSHILGMEMRLTRRSVNCAVVFATQDQWKEEDMFASIMTDTHKSVLNCIGEEVVLPEDWEHHSGGLPPGKRMYYSSFRGYEIVFHVASMLTQDEQRQFIGNDKVLIYICEQGVKPIVPRFRGDVNSVAIVLQRREAGWKMGVFCRERVAWTNCIFPGNVVPLNELRDYILAVVIDANTVVRESPPYCNIIKRVLQDQLKQVYPSKAAGDRKSQAKRRISTVKK